jgi:hypothetical protein
MYLIFFNFKYKREKNDLLKKILIKKKYFFFFKKIKSLITFPIV